MLTTFAGNKKQRMAASFLADQVDQYYGVSVSYTNEDGNNLNSTINNYLGDNDIVDSLNAYAVRDTFWDSKDLKTGYLINNIALAFSHYKENPLSISVPDSIFYEYILPYRVGYEILSDWRSYFNAIYMNYLSTFDTEKIDEKFIVDMVHHIQQLSYHVLDRTGLAKYPFPADHSLQDIREVGRPYSCEDYALFKLYSFRSIGLAAAYETVPLYGKFNFGHSETALWHRDGKFHCTEGKTQMPYKYYIAKMYRRRFSPRTSPFQQIVKAGENADNIPSYFDMPYYDDITDERTLVSDININPQNDFDRKNLSGSGVAYLCVYNDGEWKPVEWARRDRYRIWKFRNMGRKIIYHLAIYNEGLQELVGAPLILDTVGNVIQLQSVLKDGLSDVRIEKFDRNSRMNDGLYELFYWEEGLKKWISKEQFNATEKGVILSLAKNTLYKIEPMYAHSSPRPFSIENNEQIWW
ncbi:hypothetical protein [Sphingobacterium griseoflavum]|uniref:Transglutaminase-like domain-containing protein n=1 Tax=Sphingobacterium griseoflavum TaxID=1474952 RepID=A0ABQ3HZ11_9SPHI|nr:hypothetical protein [Sphingobacterium griseoflavum]GHE34160.1 hypothetical protein GCM10017764_16850 [Sphingobacterium griseoflavum]